MKLNPFSTLSSPPSPPPPPCLLDGFMRTRPIANRLSFHSILKPSTATPTHAFRHRPHSISAKSSTQTCLFNNNTTTTNLPKMPPKEKYTDPALRDKVKQDIQDSDKGGAPGQWSARKAQSMASEYKKRGGEYNDGGKGKGEGMYYSLVLLYL